MALHFEFTPSKTIAWLFLLCGIENPKMLRLRWTILVHTLNHFHSQFNRELSQQSSRGLAARVFFHKLTQQGENWMMHSVWRENLQAEAKKEQKTMRTSERDRVNGTLCVWRKLVVNYMHAPSWNRRIFNHFVVGKTVEKLMVEQLKRKPNERMNGKTRVKVIANMIQNKIPHKCHAQCTVHTLKHNGIIAHKLFMNHDQCSNALPTITCTIIVLIVLYLCQFSFCIPFIPPSISFHFWDKRRNEAEEKNWSKKLIW